MTRIEDQLMRLIADIGFHAEPEVEFAPYRVDAYCRELHVAFEADGPTHAMSSKRDARRDAELMGRYGLVVWRVRHQALRSREARERMKTMIMERCGEWADSADERREVAQDSTD